jgi:maltose alpha-D-glucosyltransferase/alpha-amylase
VVLDERLFLKGYRRLRGGTSPDVEMTRHLTEAAGFRHVPALAGFVEWRPEEGPVMTVAALFSYVQNQGDAWTYTLNHLERHCAVLLHAAAPEEGESHTLYLDQLRTIGRRVGELHSILSRPCDDDAFSPEPLRASDLASWRKRILAATERAFTELENGIRTLPENDREPAAQLLRQRSQLLRQIRRLGAGSAAIQKTRIHGDLQLGKLLLTGKDFAIIDFEGERAWTYENRRAKHLALRDVACMLRSLDHARIVALQRATADRSDQQSALARDLGQWHKASQRTFLSAYRAALGDAVCWPADRGDATRLLTLFEIEKEILQLRHELEHRPERAGVPVAGLLGLLEHKTGS